MTVKEASELLKVDQQTMRVLLQNGKFGFAIKGKGKHFIYFVNEREVKEWIGQQGI